LIEVIDYIFREGCGKSLQSILNSSRYAELRDTQDNLFIQHPEDTDTGIALRTGHLHIGRLFNTLNEAEAIAVARKINAPEFGCGLELRSLIQVLGESIVEAATECLPDEVKFWAKDWQKSDPDQQLAICKKVFSIFLSEDQKFENKGELTMDWVMESIRLRHSKYLKKSVVQVLPRQYGSWNPETSAVDCVGKAQMLIAFARLAGIKTMTLDPIMNSKRLINNWRKQAKRIVMDDINNRGLIADKSFMSSLMAEMTYQNHIETFADLYADFHAGVAFQLADQRWVLIDPHVINWGVFSAEWNLDHVYGTLLKYQDVLPGLSLISLDHKTPQRLRQEEFSKLEKLLERSRNLEKQTRTASLEDIVEILIDSKEIFFILDSLGQMPSINNLFQHINAAQQREFLKGLILGLIIGEQDQLMDVMLSMVNNPNFLKERIDSILTYYHSLVMDQFMDQLTVGGGLLHYACEFSLPEYHIAMAAINSVSLHLFSENRDERFFVDYAFDQLNLTNCIPNSFTVGNKDSNLAVAASEALKVMPFIHSFSRQRLKDYNQIGGKL